jgi:CRISPR-associated protein Cas1
MELYLTTLGTSLRKRGGLFEIRVKDEKQTVSPERVSSIIVCNAISITSDVIQLAMEHNIDIVFLNQYGDPYGRVWFPKLGSTTLIRRRLLEIHDKKEGLAVVKHLLKKKIANQMKFLKLLAKKRKKHIKAAIDEVVPKMEEYQKKIQKQKGTVDEVRQTLMAYEGNAASLYFQSLSLMLPPKYQFKSRSSRPAKDYFNAALNYGYGMLYGKVERACVIAGLDPYIGFLHTDNYNKISLVFDLIERYRIFIEQPVFYLFSRKNLKKSHFDEIKQGYKLNDDGKKILIPAIDEHFEEVIQHKNRKLKRINTIQADCHAFANYLITMNNE